MKTDFKVFLVIVITIVIIFFAFAFFGAGYNFRENLSYKFSGRVDAVSYDIKGFPNVTVNNKRYCLSAGYNFNYKIELGDTLKKRRGSNIYTLIKHKNGEILIFDN